MFLGFENAVGELRQPLNLFLVDMGFEAEVLCTQQGSMHAVADSSEAFVDILAELPRIIDAGLCVFPLNDTLAESPVEWL